MDFKHLNIEKGVEFEKEQMDFLKTLDDAFGSVVEKQSTDKKEAEGKFTAMQEQLKKMAESQNFDVMQKQLNNIFEKLDTANVRPVTQEQAGKQEKALNEKWVRAFVKKDTAKMRELEGEIKATFDPFMHTGTQTGHDNYLEQGSYLIPELFLAEVNRFVYDAGIARREMRYLPFGGPGNSRRIPVLTQSVVIEWVDEAGRKPLTKPYIGQVTQTLSKLAAIVPFTDEILEDSAVNLMSLVAQLIGEAIAIEEDRVFLSGSVIAGDPFNGVLNAVGVAAYALDPTELPADLTADDLNQVIYDIPTPARKGAKWYMHPTVFSILQRLRVDVLAAGDGLGGYLVQQPTGEMPARIWNYPVVLTDELPAADTIAADEPFMFFGNLQKTCVYGDKGSIALKMLDQASLEDAEGNTYNLAQHDMTALRAVKRVGYVPVLPEGICVVSAGAVS